VFGAEFVVTTNWIETCLGICYKLKILGVLLSGPMFVYGENMYVVHKTQRPEYVLNKNSKYMCYHVVRTSVAMRESIVGHVPSVHNTADIFTKVVPGGQKWHHLIRLLLNDPCD
jgi:hypothetical protein